MFSVGDLLAWVNVYLPILIGVVVVLGILFFLGVYVDMANRTGFPIISRKKLLASPILFSATVLGTVVPISITILVPLLTLPLSQILMFFIPSCIAIFGLVVLIGALPLWAINREKASFKKAVLLSARLILAPLIDAFWSSVACFVGATLATPILCLSIIANIVIMYQKVASAFSNGSADFWTSIGNALLNTANYGLSREASYTFAIPFFVLGIIASYSIFKKGPSKVLSWYYLLMGVILAFAFGGLFLYLYFTLITSSVLLYVTVGVFGTIFILMIVLFICLAIFCVHFLLAALFGAFRIAGVFGLSIAVLSAVLLAVFFGAIPSIPIVGQFIMSLIPIEVEVIAAQLGIAGIVVGIIIIVLAPRQEEKSQVFSRAIAISVGVSSVFPFLFILLLNVPGLFGGLIGILLVFVLISPLYQISMNLLRLQLAARALFHGKN